MTSEPPPRPHASTAVPPLALLIQPACLEHKYIRHANSSHIFERPERLRAVLLGFAAALARLEAEDVANGVAATSQPKAGGDDDLSSMLSSLSIQAPTSAFLPPSLIGLPDPPMPPSTPGQVLLHHPALQLAHSEPMEAPFPYLPRGTAGAALPSSSYLRDLFKWASEAVEMIRTTGCEIPRDPDLGLNAGDLYLGPGSILAIEGAVQTVCQAVDGVCKAAMAPAAEASTAANDASSFSKAFCAIRPPGHHCGEDLPSGFCYVNNVVVGAMHAYLEHDIDRAIIIDFDLHHGNGTQALVMPLNAASNSEDLAMAGGKPASSMRGRNGPRRGWKGFYGSVHDIYSYPCEDGDLDLIRDASVSLAGHGQYIENIHLQPYKDEADFYARIYPLYLALLDKALVYMRETDADADRTILFISAGFDACEHEHQGMQRHDRRVPVSFYSRYTKDIAAFADKHTGGKVVSVLEGGYGDRALTSAALGHAIGMLGREGRPEWWSVDELELLERAVKKRRKGKLCQLGADLAAKPHIARAHALLSHFEGAGAPQTPAPSTTATPQQPRRTLRERRPVAYDEESPAPQSRRIRKPATSTTQTPVDTPRRKTEAATPKRTPKRAPEVKVESEAEPLPSAVDLIETKPSPTKSSSKTASADKLAVKDDSQAYPSPAPSASTPPPAEPKAEPTQSAQPDAPRIMLRIPRLTPPADATTVPAAETRPIDPSTSDTRPAQPPASDTQAAPSAEPTQLAAPEPVPAPRAPSSAPAVPSSVPPRSDDPTPPPRAQAHAPVAGTFRPGVMESVQLPPSPARQGRAYPQPPSQPQSQPQWQQAGAYSQYGQYRGHTQLSPAGQNGGQFAGQSMPLYGQPAPSPQIQPQHDQYQGQHPGQFQPQHPGQFHGQHPGHFQPQHPGQFRPQHPSQFPDQHQHLGQYPAQYEHGQYSGQVPGNFPGQFPGQFQGQPGQPSQPGQPGQATPPGYPGHGQSHAASGQRPPCSPVYPTNHPGST